MKQKILICLMLTSIQWLTAQTSFEYTEGYGIYMQKDGLHTLMKEKLSKIKATLPNAKIVADFPNYFTYSLAFNYRYGNEEFGFAFTKMSTGGKISYADYSGAYSNELNLTGIRLGTRYRHEIKSVTIAKKYKAILFGELSPGVIISKLKNTVEDKYKDETVAETADDDYGTTQFSLLPQLGLKMNFGRFGAQLLAGYDFSFAGKLENSYQTKISWMGARIGLGLTYTFPPRKKKEKPDKDNNSQDL